MDSYSLKAVLSASDQGFTSKMSGAVKTMENLEEGAQKSTSSIKDIASGIGVFKLLSKATDVLTSSLDGAIRRFDTLNQYPKVMQQIGFSAEKSDASVSRLSEGIDGLPTSLDSIVASTQNIAVLTRDIDKATETSIALNDAFLASGAATADAERGLTQYVQMLSKGQVDLQSWRTLQETMGPALYEVAAAFGYAGSSAQNDLYAALKDGAITFDQFNDKLIELDGGVNGFAERARTASAGIGTSFQNLQTAVVRGMEKVIRAADNSLSEAGLPNFQQSLEITKDKVNETFTIATAVTEKFVDVAAPGIKFVGNNLDAIVSVLGTATAGFIAYKAAMDIDAKAKKFKEAIEKSAKAVNSAKDAEKLAAKAIMAKTEAADASRVAEKLRTKAEIAAEEATRAKMAADELAAKAEKAKAEIAEKGAAAEVTQAEAEKLSKSAAMASAEADKKAAAAKNAKAVAVRANTQEAIKNTAAEEVNSAAETSGAAAAQLSNIAIATKSALLGVLSGELSVATAAQTVFNTAVKANPIGAAIIAITALIAVIVGVTKAMQKYCEKHETLSYRQKEARKATEELAESLEESEKTYKENYKEAKNNAGAVYELAKKTAILAKKTNRSAADTELLKSNVESLNSSVDDLNLAYDEETGKLNMTEDAMLSLVEAYKKQAEAEIYAERYKEILEQQLDVEDQLAESAELLKEAQERCTAATQMGGSVSVASAIQLEKLQKAVEELENQQDTLEQEEQELTETMAKCKTEQTEATQAAADAQIASNESIRINLEELSDAQQDTLDRIVEAYETMTGSLSSLNEEIEENDELTWSQVQKNQEDTIAKTQEFAELYQQAIEAGISESYLNAIGATGPEALPLLRGMMQSGVDEVLSSQAEWEAAYDSISKTFVDSMQLSDEDKATLRSYIAGEAGVLGTIEQALKGADFTELGQDGVAGYAEGWQDSSDVQAAVHQTIADGILAAKKEQNSNSPSKVYKGLAGDAIDGYILGLEGKEGVLNSTMQSIMGSAGKVASKALDDSMKGMSLISTTAFSKISAAAKTGMRSTTTEITDGMKTSNSAVKNGMDMMNSAVSSRMHTIQTLMTAGMQRITQVVELGMNAAKTKTVSDTKYMALAVAGLEDEFYSSGYYASLGLAKGINAGSAQAIAAAQRLANSVSSTINKALKIHSPSDVTWESGEFTTEGLAGGMLDKIAIVKRASEKIAAAAVPTGEISRLAESAGRVAVNTNFAYSGDVDATYKFVIPVVIDGREAARATATYTQEELNKQDKLNKYMKGYR